MASLAAVCEATARHLNGPLDAVRQRALTLLPVLMRNGVALIDWVDS